MRSTTSFAPLAFSVLVLLPFAACHVTRYKDTHCSNNDGDEFCRREHPGYSLPYCSFDCEPDVFDGCVAIEPEPSCYSACGGRLPLTEDPTCEPVPPPEGTTSTGTSTETDPTSGESEGTESSSTTGPIPCQGNQDCPEDGASFCEPSSGECVSCDGTTDPDASCAELDPAAPLCVGGACVECTAKNPVACTGKAPICDDASNTCVPCTMHDQCGEAACNLFTGACLPADAVVHVGGPMPDFPSLTMAVASFDPMTEGTIVVHAGSSYDEAVTVDGGRVLAFLAAEIGAGVEPPRWIRSSGNTPQLTVSDATVLVDGMQVSGNASSMVSGVLVDAGRAWLDRSRIVTNLGGGIVAQNDAELVLRNCFVGGDISNTDALIVNSATATVVYASVLAGDGGLGQSRALVCDDTASVDMRNSVLVAIDDVPEIACGVAVVSNSATEGAMPGEGNVSIGNIQAGWFVDVANDFHLASPPAALVTAAQWDDGDPLVDIDGEPRPGVDGLSDAAGADVP